MYLVDTSIWIDYFRGKAYATVKHFLDLVEQDVPFGITGVIYQEILQGATNQLEFDRLLDEMGTQRFYDVGNSIKSYELAAELYFKCRRKGITIRSTIDCLIAQVAIENDLTLLHNDIDYVHLAKVAPLKIYPKTLSVAYTYPQVHDSN